MSSKTNACVWSSMFSSKNTAFAQEVLFILNSSPDELLEVCEDDQLHPTEMQVSFIQRDEGLNHRRAKEGQMSSVT